MLTAAKKLHEPKLVHFRLDDFIYTHCIHVITTLQSKLVKPRYGFIFQKKKLSYPTPCLFHKVVCTT